MFANMVLCTLLFQAIAPSSLYFTFPTKAFKSPNEIN